MKIRFTLIVLLFVILSCKQTKVKNNDSALVGKWSIYQTIAFQDNDDSVSNNCTTCPKIEFIKDHTGSIKRLDDQLQHFDWEINEDGLAITHNPDDKIKGIIIDDGTYQLIPGDKKAIKQITLSDTVKNLKYILRR
ncbi:MAG TPA: hypothetical protein VK668_22590 [Mucilaginibacter sp.]|nr:hypothetical protein [Mucilaginibacter sp.]